MRGSSLVVDVLPHLANMLKDKGTLLVSNTAKDGYRLEDAAAVEEVELAEFGLRAAGKQQKLFNFEDRDSGLSSYERDYGLRPGATSYHHGEYKPYLIQLLEKQQSETRRER